MASVRTVPGVPLARCITMNESTCSVSSSVRAAVVATFTADATRDCSRSPLESRLTDTAAAVEAAVAHNTCRGDRVSREWIMHDRAARALYPALWIARETRLVGRQVAMSDGPLRANVRRAAT